MCVREREREIETAGQRWSKRCWQKERFTILTLLQGLVWRPLYLVLKYANFAGI